MDKNSHEDTGGKAITHEEEESRRKKALKFAFKGLYIELSSIISAILAALSLLVGFWSSFVFFLFVIFALYTLVAPVIGCLWGFVTMFDSHRTRGSIAVSVISFLLPIVTVTAIILMLSTGVIVIRLM